MTRRKGSSSPDTQGVCRGLGSTGVDGLLIRGPPEQEQACQTPWGAPYPHSPPQWRTTALIHEKINLKGNKGLRCALAYLTTGLTQR